MIPLTALVAGLPNLQVRGAFMSINASFQQIAGGFAVLLDGFITVQPGGGLSLNNFDFIGYLIVLVSVLNIFILGKVNMILKSPTKDA